MKQIAKYKLFLGLFTFCWINSILPAFAAPDAYKPIYALTVYEDFDNDNKAEILTAALSGHFCQITAQFKDHKQTIPILMPEAATFDIDIVARDVNSNSYKDLIIVNKRTHEILSVILNNCDGTFSPTRYNCISKDNFNTEIVRKKSSCSGRNSGEFSNIKLSIQFLDNTLNTPCSTVVCCLNRIHNNFNLQTIGFILPDREIISSTSYLETDLPRGPPLL
jgi:hypothetical protein